MEEEFGMRELPQTVTFRWEQQVAQFSSPIHRLKISVYVCLSLGLPSMLRIPPKRKKTLT